MSVNEQPPAPPTPRVPRSLAPPRWRSLRSWSYAAYVGLGLIALLILVVVVTEIQILATLDHRFETRSEALHFVDLNNRLDDLDDVLIALSLVTAVVFITWMWRAAKNNQALGRERPRFGPGWAIGGWFIPIANLVIPVLIVQDLWRGSNASVARGDMRWKIGDRSALVGWWWGLAIGSRVLNAIGNGVGDSGILEDVRGGVSVQIVGNTLYAAAAVLAILVVRGLTQRQEECLRVQNEHWRQQSESQDAPAPPAPAPPAPAPPV
jgi:hypothetical protein